MLRAARDLPEAHIAERLDPARGPLRLPHAVAQLAELGRAARERVAIDADETRVRAARRRGGDAARSAAAHGGDAGDGHLAR